VIRANAVEVETIRAFRRAFCRIPDCGWTGEDRHSYQEANADREKHLAWHREGEPREPTVPEKAREEVRQMWNAAFGHDPF
jgi:hypothetical protein